jgi:hypothetical protein
MAIKKWDLTVFWNRRYLTNFWIALQLYFLLCSLIKFCFIIPLIGSIGDTFLLMKVSLHFFTQWRRIFNFQQKSKFTRKNRDTKTKLLGITGSITLLFFCNITHWNSIEDFNFKVEMCFFFETSKPICLLISQMVVCERKWTKLTRKFVNDRRTDGQNLLGGERGRRQRGRDGLCWARSDDTSERSFLTAG